MYCTVLYCVKISRFYAGECLLMPHDAGACWRKDKPVMLEEGMMTLLRKNVVSNARLIKCADGRGLRVTEEAFNNGLSRLMNGLGN